MANHFNEKNRRDLGIVWLIAGLIFLLTGFSGGTIFLLLGVVWLASSNGRGLTLFRDNPDDMRSFIDQAHALGLGVILDVVYNHVGNVGSFLRMFSKTYFSKGKNTDWGEAINFDEEGSDQAREFFISNAGYWIDEFHLDGLRLDATQNIYDTSSKHIIAAITQHAREAATERRIVIVAENEPQLIHYVDAIDDGGYGCRARHGHGHDELTMFRGMSDSSGHDDPTMTISKGTHHEIQSTGNRVGLFSPWPDHRRRLRASDHDNILRPLWRGSGAQESQRRVDVPG